MPQDVHIRIQNFFQRRRLLAIILDKPYTFNKVLNCVYGCRNEFEESTKPKFSLAVRIHEYGVHKVGVTALNP